MSNYDFTKPKSTKARIVAAVQHFSTISVKDISNYCDLSIPIVTRYLEPMIQDGLLIENTSSVTTTGRKPKLLSLDADYCYIIGIELGLLDMAKIGVFKFDGSLVINESVLYASDWNAEEIIRRIMSTIETALKSNSIELDRIRHIVIGNPGIVNPDTGSMVLPSEFSPWSKLSLKDLFQQKFGIPVEVLNDVNLAAIGEKEFGVGRGYSNFIFVRQSVGLKSGIILKNRLYQGESYAAGEIGQCTLNVLDGGNIVYRKAESLLRMSAICSQIADMLNDNPNDIFWSITGGNPQNVTVDNIIKALGTPSYINDEIVKYGEMLGTVLVNVVAALDIALIILGGDVTKFNNYYIKPIRDVLSEHLIYPPTVLTSSLGNDVALYGAFAVGQENILANIP